MKTRYRTSLTEDENKALELAGRLAHAVDGSDPLRAGIGRTEDEEDARERMRRKVRSIARMARMFKTLRQENEAVIRLKGMCPGHKLAPGLLLAGKERLQSELEVFSHVAHIDTDNEKRPDGAGGAAERDFVNDDE